MVKEVPRIPEKGYPVTEKKYPEGHRAGNRAEISEYGTDDYKDFQKWIDKNVPEGELAGSNLPDGMVLIRKDVPRKHKGKLILHERTEGEVITGKELDTEPRGKGRTKQSELSKNRIREHKMREAMRHPDKPGAGAAKRRKLSLTQKEKVAVVMREYERGTLRSGSGKIVTSRKQALAIAHSEARKVK